MLEFIKVNISSVVVVLLFIVGLLILYKRNKKELVRQIVFIFSSTSRKGSRKWYW